ncbi:hypothetical protein BDZ45DRAFT_671522 [Acephala macrosclerotiorum]|nr:hypothetical protein BDZ45DRAFT_671522 [Acephala macrosclerotiorum]
MRCSRVAAEIELLLTCSENWSMVRSIKALRQLFGAQVLFRKKDMRWLRGTKRRFSFTHERPAIVSPVMRIPKKGSRMNPSKGFDLSKPTSPLSVELLSYASCQSRRPLVNLSMRKAEIKACVFTRFLQLGYSRAIMVLQGFERKAFWFVFPYRCVPMPLVNLLVKTSMIGPKAQCGLPLQSFGFGICRLREIAF